MQTDINRFILHFLLIRMIGWWRLHDRLNNLRLMLVLFKRGQRSLLNVSTWVHYVNAPDLTIRADLNLQSLAG